MKTDPKTLKPLDPYYVGRLSLGEPLLRSMKRRGIAPLTAVLREFKGRYWIFTSKEDYKQYVALQVKRSKRAADRENKKMGEDDLRKQFVDRAANVFKWILFAIGGILLFQIIRRWT